MVAFEKLVALMERDIECECKNIEYPLDEPHVIHCHDGYEILLVTEGEINYYVEGDGGKLGRGDIVCVNAYDFHHIELVRTDVYNRAVVNFKPSVIERLSGKNTDLMRVFARRTPSRLNLLHLSDEKTAELERIALLIAETIREKEFGSELLSDAYLTEFLVKLNRYALSDAPMSFEKVMPRIVTRIFEYVDMHLTEEISLKILETELKYNGTYISRCFKKITGISLQQYIIAKRVTLAQQYLREGIQATDVCFMTGFNDYSNFSRTFCKQVGKSPRKYQAENI